MPYHAMPYRAGTIRMTPVYHDGVVYVGSDADYIYALDADSFELKWKRNKKLISNPRGIPVIAKVPP